MNHRENVFQSRWEFWHSLVFVRVRAHQHLCAPATVLAALWLIPAALSLIFSPPLPLCLIPVLFISRHSPSAPLSTRICDSQTCCPSLQGAGRGQRDGRVPQTQAHATGQTGQSHTEWVALIHWHVYSYLTGAHRHVL